MGNVVSACFYPVLLVITWTPRSSLPQNLAFHILKLLINLCFLYLCFVLICYPSAISSVQVHVVETFHIITDKLLNFNSCCSSALVLFNRHSDTIKCW